jgi:CBS domain containing-hemolysin-like protein
MHASESVPWALAAVSHAALPWQVVILIVALIASAISSASETALTSVNRIRIKNLAEEGDVRAQQIVTLLQKPQRFLTTILVINNVAVILASSMATVIALSYTPQWGEVISTIITSLVVLVFCEVTPKNAAVRNAETWARGLVPLIAGVAWILRPVTALINTISAAIMRLFGIPMEHLGPSVTEDELRLLVNVGEEEGVFEEGERTMIHHIFELSDTTVREVMVPRIDMVTLPAETPIARAVDIITQGGQSRIPVYEETIDNIIGVLYAKDILPQLQANHQQTPVRNIVRPAYFVPESKKLDDLLHELQNLRVHMAIVLDEYGSVVGLVTIEDLVEEIIGDIQDEYDREEREYEHLSDGSYVVAAKMNIDDFNELLGIELEAGEEYDTIGGFMITMLDKIPSVGDIVTTDDVTLTVLATRGRRITKIQAVLVRPEEHQHAQPATPTNGRGVAPPPVDEAPQPLTEQNRDLAAENKATDEATAPPQATPHPRPSGSRQGVVVGRNDNRSRNRQRRH